MAGILLLNVLWMAFELQVGDRVKMRGLGTCSCRAISLQAYGSSRRPPLSCPNAKFREVGQ